MIGYIWRLIFRGDGLDQDQEDHKDDWQQDLSQKAWISEP